jgi:hypothetical protein
MAQVGRFLPVSIEPSAGGGMAENVMDSPKLIVLFVAEKGVATSGLGGERLDLACLDVSCHFRGRPVGIVLDHLMLDTHATY